MTTQLIPDFPIEIILGLKPCNIDFPLDWTPEQAEAALNILGQIEEKIWYLFGDDIIEMQKSDRIFTSSPSDLDDKHNHNDDIPF